MEQLINRAVELFQEPYDDRDERDAGLPSLRAVADQLYTTILRTRKSLIMAGYYSTETSRLVQKLAAEGKTEAEIMEITRLRRASVNSYLPYQKLAFNLDQKTANADRHRLFRRRISDRPGSGTSGGPRNRRSACVGDQLPGCHLPLRTGGHQPSP